MNPIKTFFFTLIFFVTSINPYFISASENEGDQSENENDMEMGLFKAEPPGIEELEEELSLLKATAVNLGLTEEATAKILEIEEAIKKLAKQLDCSNEEESEEEETRNCSTLTPVSATNQQLEMLASTINDITGRRRDIGEVDPKLKKIIRSLFFDDSGKPHDFSNARKEEERIKKLETRLHKYYVKKKNNSILNSELHYAELMLLVIANMGILSRFFQKGNLPEKRFGPNFINCCVPKGWCFTTSGLYKLGTALGVGAWCIYSIFSQLSTFIADNPQLITGGSNINPNISASIRTFTFSLPSLILSTLLLNYFGYKAGIIGSAHTKAAAEAIESLRESYGRLGQLLDLYHTLRETPDNDKYQYLVSFLKDYLLSLANIGLRNHREKDEQKYVSKDFLKPINEGKHAAGDLSEAGVFKWLLKIIKRSIKQNKRPLNGHGGWNISFGKARDYFLLNSPPTDPDAEVYPALTIEEENERNVLVSYFSKKGRTKVSRKVTTIEFEKTPWVQKLVFDDKAHPVKPLHFEEIERSGGHKLFLHDEKARRENRLKGYPPLTDQLKKPFQIKAGDSLNSTTLGLESFRAFLYTGLLYEEMRNE